MTEEAATGLMRREEALADLKRRVEEGQSVTNHHRDDDPISSPAQELLVGLGNSELTFGYFIQDGEAHVITGQLDKMSVEGKFIALQIERNEKDLPLILAETSEKG